MIRGNTKRNFAIAIMVSLCGLLGLSLTLNVSAQGQRSRTAFKGDTAVSQQPLYSEYKGVRLGMTAEEVRAKLGKPALKDVDQDFYIFTDNESTQIAYNADHRVVTISTDYTEGIGAPDYRAVVGDVNVEQRQNGLYRIARYPSLGFWGIVQSHGWFIGNRYDHTTKDVEGSERALKPDCCPRRRRWKAVT